MRSGFHLAILVCLAAGCASYRVGPTAPPVPRFGEMLPDPEPARVRALTRDLLALGRGVDGREARDAAQLSLAYSLYLADAYRTMRPAVLHNVLVNSGLRGRGLCYHYADDLAFRLERVSWRSFTVQRAVANAGQRHEHNVVVLVPTGHPLESGLILDAWVGGGYLRWKPVLAHRYRWESVPDAVWRAPGASGRVPAVPAAGHRQAGGG
jgi:hypothetical protein